MKPWEKYAQNNAQKGPWNKYQDQSGTIANYADKLNPDQTQPEWLSTTDRMVAKNFAQSVPKQVEYLKQQYPDKEFSINANGQVLAKAQGDSKWQVMDPDTGLFSSDILKDVGDIAYDIPAGIASNAAATAGAVGGTAVGGPLAGMAGASAASGATGAGLEAIRQKLGQYLGIPQEVNSGDVVQSGVVNAISPVLFGAGPVKGLIKQAGEKILPKVGQFMSGISPEDMKAYANNYNTVDDLAKGEGGGILNYAQELSNKVNSGLDKKASELGKNVSSAIDDAKIPVDLSNSKDAVMSKIDEYLNKTELTKNEALELNKLQDLYDRYFTTTSGSEVSNLQTGVRAFDLQQQLKRATKFGSDLTPENQNALQSARGAYHEINRSLDEATQGASKEAKDAYANWKGIENDISPKFTDAQKTYQTISNLDGKGKALLRERLKNLASDGTLDIGNEADVIKAYNAFKDPAYKKSNTGLMTALGALGSLIGYKTGSGYAGAAVGGAAGVGAGKLLGSQGVMSNLVKGTVNANKLSGPMSNVANSSAPTIIDILNQLEFQREAAKNYSQ